MNVRKSRHSEGAGLEGKRIWTENWSSVQQRQVRNFFAHIWLSKQTNHNIFLVLSTWLK